MKELMFAAFVSIPCLVGVGPGVTHPDLVVVVDDAILVCSGCASSIAITTDDRLIECPDGTPGASISVTGSQATSIGTCRDWAQVEPPSPCYMTGGCGWKAEIQVAWYDQSCLTTVWIEGPGIPGRNPIGGSWPNGSSLQLASQVLCSDNGDALGPVTSFKVFDQQTGGNQLAAFEFQVKCSQCKPR